MGRRLNEDRESIADSSFLGSGTAGSDHGYTLKRCLLDTETVLGDSPPFDPTTPGFAPDLPDLRGDQHLQALDKSLASQNFPDLLKEGDSAEPADTTKNGPKPNTHLELTPAEHLEIIWGDSCTTTVRCSDSGFPDIGSQKQLRLFPLPNEADEIGLNDTPEVPATQTPVLDEKLQANDLPLQLHRRALHETVLKLQSNCSVMLET
jgi:hypothetical protein